MPSPYQVELFDSIANDGYFDLTIAYLYKSSHDRLWKQPQINHNHIILNDQQEKYNALKILINSIDLVIFNYYQLFIVVN